MSCISKLLKSHDWSKDIPLESLDTLLVIFCRWGIKHVTYVSSPGIVLSYFLGLLKHSWSRKKNKSAFSHFGRNRALKSSQFSHFRFFIPKNARLKIAFSDSFISDFIGARPVWNGPKSDQQVRGRVKWLSNTGISFALLIRLFSV